MEHTCKSPRWMDNLAPLLSAAMTRPATPNRCRVSVSEAMRACRELDEESAIESLNDGQSYGD